VGGLILATSGGDDDDPGPTAGSSSTTTPVTTTEGATPATSGGGGSGGSGSGGSGGGSGGGESSAGLEVIDSGFSNYPSPYDDTNHVSYGYVIENTTDEPATSVEVTIALLDTDGTVVSSDTEYINYLAPGAKIGQGDEPLEEVPEVAEIQVQAAIPSYASEPTATGELTPANVTTTDDGDRYTTTFEVTSTYEVQLDSPSAYVVYYDSSGKIVGGSYGFLSIVQPGGTTSAEVTSYELIPNVDPSKTEVYVDPGYI
jgi:hypothetical protein